MDDVMSIGYIKAQFPHTPDHPGLAKKVARFTSQYPTRRVTDYFTYIALGHTLLTDNDDARRIVHEIFGLGGKITRIDLAVDVCDAFDFKSYHEMMNEYYKHPEFGKTIGLPARITSLTGDTEYIGKRSSARFFRVYDKRAEVLAKKRVDIGFDLTRFEIECKRLAVGPYLGLFMVGKTDVILADIADRYRLPWLVDHPKRILPTSDNQNKSSIFDFVYRYRRILKTAYETDKRSFLDLIGVYNE